MISAIFNKIKMKASFGRRMSTSTGMLTLLAIYTFINIKYYKSASKPSVTATLIAANSLIYLRPSFLRSIIPSIDQVWFNSHLIFKNKDLKRFSLSAFYHFGEPHLVYNMISLLWKGIQLETSTGSFKFASMVASLLALSQSITLILSKSLLLLFDYDRPYYHEYSGVLFAMKVVLNSQSDSYVNVHGVQLPSRYAAWAELILIQMYVRGVSFHGHLSGILAGILYLRLKRAYSGSRSGSKPLRSIVRGFNGVLKWPVRFIRHLFRFRRRRSLLSVCYEMCGISRGRTGIGLSSSQWNLNDRDYYDSDGLSLDQLRRRMIESFGK